MAYSHSNNNGGRAVIGYIPLAFVFCYCHEVVPKEAVD